MNGGHPPRDIYIHIPEPGKRILFGKNLWRYNKLRDRGIA
jgi:hypothetical protein